MANLVLVGTISEVNDGEKVFEYFDGDKYPAVELTIHQPQYEAIQKANGWDYYPPRVKFTVGKLAGYVPSMGDRVSVACTAVVSDPVKNAQSKNFGKQYVNLKGKSIEVVK